MMPNDTLVIAAAALWGASGVVLVARRRSEPIGAVLTAGGALGFASLSEGARPLVLGLLPAVLLHLIAGVPEGRVQSTGRRVTVGIGYAAGVGLGVFLARSEISMLWPVVGACVVAGIVGAFPATGRYRRARGEYRKRMQWFGWAVTVAACVAAVSGALRLLVGWPADAAAVALVGTAPVPLGFLLAGLQRTAVRIDRMLAHTVSLAGLTGVVLAAYVLIVVGLGRIPSQRERTIIGLSMAAAAVSALLYIPTRERLANLANRIVYGERHAPDEVLRSFGSRLSRAIPMDELLLQMAESVRKTMTVDLVEVWTGSDGTLDRTVSDPERGPARMIVKAAERPVVARAGVSGPAWIKIWLPEVLGGREESMVRVAPITHSGELLGLIVVERRESNEPLGEENERVLGELARQVGVSLHNVRLDSALQASLDELRKQAEYLRASRERIVRASDAARRQIERDLHDGAQQHLVALKVKMRLAQRMADTDAAAAQKMLGELVDDLQTAIEEMRRLSHGIFPKPLVDRGLVAGLEAAAGRSAMPAVVEAATDGKRYPMEIETAVYFCCNEALQNAAKHAGDGARVVMRVWEDEGALLFEIADDGAGFDRASAGLGAGFTNMEDRLGAIGGTLTVDSAPGRGTRIAGRVPLRVTL